MAIDRDVRWHAVKLEQSETRRKEEPLDERKVLTQNSSKSEHPPSGKRKAGDEDEGRAPDQLGGSSSSSSRSPAEPSGGMKGPKVKSKFVEKRRVVHGAPAVDLCPPSETAITLPSFGKVVLRPKRDASDASESQRRGK